MGGFRGVRGFPFFLRFLLFCLLCNLASLVDDNVLLVWSEFELSLQFFGPPFLNCLDPPMTGYRIPLIFEVIVHLKRKGNYCTEGGKGRGGTNHASR